MKEYYIKFISKTLKDAIELAEKLWYSMIYGYTNPRSFVWYWILALDKSWFYFTSTRDEKTLISYWFKELKLYDKLEPWTKVEIISNHIWTKWNICTINYCIDDCFDEDMWYLYSLKETHYNFHSEDIREIQSTEWNIFKVWDLIKEWNNVYKVTNDTNVAFNIHTWIKIEINNKSNFQLYEHKELAKHVNYYFDNDWKRQALNVKENNLKPDVLTDGQTYTLINNNNTMKQLNKLRADKFFASEKNLTAIESLDTLINNAIELIKSTDTELGKIQLKLMRLDNKLEEAINNQDVDILKDLISSTKIVESFIKELEDKTISKFENAKTKFDVAWYLKD